MGLISWIKKKNFERKTAKLVAELEERRIIREALKKDKRAKKMVQKKDAEKVKSPVINPVINQKK